MGEREGQILGVKKCSARARPGEHNHGNSFQQEAEPSRTQGIGRWAVTGNEKRSRKGRWV